MYNDEYNLSVTQVCDYIKGIFNAEEMLIGISIFGEITNLKNSGRAVYFDLKDETSALSCICFDEGLLEGVGFGTQVLVKGRFNFYNKTGKLSFIVSKVSKYGMGELFVKYLETKERLEKEGLFDVSHKKQLPAYAKTIGVVSSETGAVIRDIIKVARSKNVSSDIVLFPAKVQGVGAVAEIVRGIKYLDSCDDIDVIIVARGGGSFEDYQPFNTEELARVVYEAKKPIVSAVGHENDWTIIDFVADARASTPSVASEMVVFDEKGACQEIASHIRKIYSSVSFKVSQFVTESQSLIKEQGIHLKNKIEKSELLIASLVGKLFDEVEDVVERSEQALQLMETKIETQNPKMILSRGYAKIEKGNKAVLSVADVSPGDEVSIRMTDGEMTTQILRVEGSKR